LEIRLEQFIAQNLIKGSPSLPANPTVVTPELIR
jgi:hypothetical protein